MDWICFSEASQIFAVAQNKTVPCSCKSDIGLKYAIFLWSLLNFFSNAFFPKDPALNLNTEYIKHALFTVKKKNKKQSSFHFFFFASIYILVQ